MTEKKRVIVAQGVAYQQFALISNPFYILSSELADDVPTLRANCAAAQATMPQDPRVAEQAYHAITDPKTRLKAEIRWLIGMDKLQIQLLIHADELVPSTHYLPLTNANIIANYFNQSYDNTALTDWLAAWDAVDSHHIATLLNYLRARSGFPLIEMHDLTAALSELRQQHIDALLYDTSSLQQILPWLNVQVDQSKMQPPTTGETLRSVIETAERLADLQCAQRSPELDSLCAQLTAEPVGDDSEAHITVVFAQIASHISELLSLYAPIVSLRQQFDAGYRPAPLYDVSQTLLRHVNYSPEISEENRLTLVRMARLVNQLSPLIIMADPIDGKRIVESNLAAARVYQSLTQVNLSYPDFMQQLDLLEENLEPFYGDILAQQFGPDSAQRSVASTFYSQLETLLVQPKSVPEQVAIYDVVTHRLSPLKAEKLKEIEALLIYYDALVHLLARYPIQDVVQHDAYQARLLASQTEAYMAWENLLLTGNLNQAHLILSEVRIKYAYNPAIIEKIHTAMDEIRETQDLLNAVKKNVFSRLIWLLLIVVGLVFITRGLS